MTGVYTNCAIPPGRPPGHAAHVGDGHPQSEADIDRALDGFAPPWPGGPRAR